MFTGIWNWNEKSSEKMKELMDSLEIEVKKLRTENESLKAEDKWNKSEYEELKREFEEYKEKSILELSELKSKDGIIKKQKEIIDDLLKMVKGKK